MLAKIMPSSYDVEVSLARASVVEAGRKDLQVCISAGNR